MILTDYYKFTHTGNVKTRFDLAEAIEKYPPFEGMRNKQNKLFLYVCQNTHTKAGNKGKSDLSISNRNGKHISSIYRPDISTNLGYGDVKDTTDALLFRFSNFQMRNGVFDDRATIEIFVARGYSKDRQTLYSIFSDGELSEEIEDLKNDCNLKKYEL